MARTRNRLFPLTPNAALKAIVVLGGIWLLGKLMESVDSKSALGVLILAGLGAVLWFFDANRRVAAATVKAIETHIETLVRRRAQLLTTDAYGRVQSEKWRKEISRFVESQFAPSLPSPFYRKRLEKRFAAVARQIEDRVAEASAKSNARGSLTPNATPTEFEAFCAEQLRQSGWDAQLTKGSGDQGADVIATKNGVRIVLQCKLYSKPVGNKAVQEAVAGKLHERAHYAAVVSNNLYTAAAEQLARTTGVMLLHHSELCRIDVLIGKAEAKTFSR